MQGDNKPKKLTLADPLMPENQPRADMMIADLRTTWAQHEQKMRQQQQQQAQAVDNATTKKLRSRARPLSLSVTESPSSSASGKSSWKIGRAHV